MMPRTFYITTFLFLSAIFSGCFLNAQSDEEVEKKEKPGPHGIVPGEKLTYELRWSFFPVGKATLSLDEDEFEGEEALKITMKAETNSFADSFFKVRNNSESYIDPEVTHALHWHKVQHEGDHHRDVVVTFDWENETAQYSNFGEEREPIEIKPGTFDPLSIVFAFRNLPLEVGKTLEIPTTNGKRMMMTEIDIVRRERIKTAFGKIDAVVVEPNTKDLGGVFKESEDASMRFWVSDDDRRLILKMESEVAIGSFWANIASIEGPGADKYTEDEKEKEDRRGRRRR